ncbi:TPA: hypothetical protein ACGO1T_000548 [Streptococcus suis]
MNTIDLSFIATRLEADIRSIIREEVRKICMDTLKEVINSTVYANPVVMYQRTHGFLNAVDITFSSIGSTSAEFFLTVNPGKIAPFIPPAPGAPLVKGARWGKHVDFDGSHVTDTLIKRLDEGFSNKYYSRPGAKFFDKTQKELGNKIPQIMRAALMARGWEVS